MHISRRILIKNSSLTIFMGSILLLLAISIAFLPSIHLKAQLTDSDNRVQLDISNITLGDSATGLTSVNGVILNNSTFNVENIEVDVTLLDATNNTIRETSRFATAPFTVVEPNETETFEFLILVEDYDHYEAIAYAERVD